MKFGVDIDISPPELKDEIEQYEIKNELVLPRDYKYLLLNFNELRLANDALGMILDQKGEEISGLDGPIYSLESFRYASDPYPAMDYVDEGAAKEAAKNFSALQPYSFKEFY